MLPGVCLPRNRLQKREYLHARYDAMRLAAPRRVFIDLVESLSLLLLGQGLQPKATPSPAVVTELGDLITHGQTDASIIRVSALAR